MMTERATPPRRGSYGIDAPLAPIFMAAMACAVLVTAIVSGRRQPLVSGTFILAVLGCYLYNSLRGKFVVWARLLDELALYGWMVFDDHRRRRDIISE